MRARTEERKPSATIPVGAAQRFLADLDSAGGGLNAEIADRLRSQVTIAALSGVEHIDVEATIVRALIRSADEPAPAVPLPSHRSRVTPPVDTPVPEAPTDEPVDDAVDDSVDDSVDDEIDHLVDLVIDLR
ncbi:MAG: hypothetical protein KJN63_12035 [Acidimicrobiia bacterium]|nr:hypothetical protein [Acidimicrobiia bacterium]